MLMLRRALLGRLHAGADERRAGRRPWRSPLPSYSGSAGGSRA
ncbi:hypothetical protein HMPREF9946_02041 [Acetobacteraceae bacterium AT-5844]|nr:hypothetical protein HMPREF9946_02041 [Acetobacteraceae bacterium AT-5844]